MPRHSESTLAAIKQSLDLVALVGEYLPLHRSGSKYKALCPFHDDHNPSLELNPERQSYKCWSCGAGGDIFDFVKNIEHVDFSEALRMLAERAGVTLEGSAKGPNSRGPVAHRAAGRHRVGRARLRRGPGRLGRGPRLRRGSGDLRGERRAVPPRLRPRVPRLAAGACPEGRPLGRGPRAGRPGLAPADRPGRVHERFRGRLMFPIHDLGGARRSASAAASCRRSSARSPRPARGSRNT